MSEWLFVDQREHPACYRVQFRGSVEKTVSIRGGISYPMPGKPGYFCLAAQLETKDIDGSLRFLVFHEAQADLLPDLFRLIAAACERWRVDALCQGDSEDEKQFCYKLENYLHKKEKVSHFVQMPSLGWLPRPMAPDFLAQLVRNCIADKTLLFFNLSDNHTPLLLDRIRHTSLDTDIVSMPELTALAHCMNNFNMGPWSPPQEWEKKTY